jgi:proteasome lid subunit RPN8/RPN11
LRLPRPLFEEMLAQAEAESPNECCGLLAGRLIPRPGMPPLADVERRYPLVNELASPREFVTEGKSMFAATRDMDRLKLDMLAVYHSHPTSAPVPSKTDLERNWWPQLMVLIISLQGPKAEVRGWWLEEKSYREAEWEVLP